MIKGNKIERKVLIQRIFQIFILVIFVILLVVISKRQESHKSDKADFSSVSQSPKIDFDMSLRHMSDNEFLGERQLKQLVSAFFFGNKDDKTLNTFLDCYIGSFIVPGMINSLDCTEEVPQGLALVDDNLLITAYCSAQKHKPMVHIIDYDSGEYINTILLENPKWHVGGITSKGDNIYITTGMNKLERKSTVSIFNKSDILDTTELGKTVSSVKDIELDKKSNAFVTYNPYNEQVYVGGYKLNSFLTDTILNIDTLQDIRYTSFMQDMEFLEYNGKQYTLISRSVGSANSTLEFYEGTFENTQNQNQTFKKSKVYTLSCPSFMEGIAIDRENNIMYCLFESAADKYKHSTDTPLDRIMLLDLNKICDNL